MLDCLFTENTIVFPWKLCHACGASFIKCFCMSFCHTYWLKGDWGVWKRIWLSLRLAYVLLSCLIDAMFPQKKCAKSGSNIWFLNGRNSSKMLHCITIDKSTFKEGICFSYWMACWAWCKGDKEARQDFVHWWPCNIQLFLDFDKRLELQRHMIRRVVKGWQGCFDAGLAIFICGSHPQMGLLVEDGSFWYQYIYWSSDQYQLKMAKHFLQKDFKAKISFLVKIDLSTN